MYKPKNRKLNLAMAGIAVLTLLFLFASIAPATAFTVTGKQTVTIPHGNSNQEITVTNPTDDILMVELTVTEEQYYCPFHIPFPLSENWEAIYNEYEWQRVEWINVKYGEVILSPHTTETIPFVINVPEDIITTGTLYAKLDVKDIGKKEGLIVIRPVYVSQVVAHIETENTDKSDSASASLFFLKGLFAIIIILLVVLFIYFITHFYI